MKYFSVVVPTRNGLQTLPKTIDTVLEQNFDDLEILVSDNKSDDDTRSYVHSLKDERIKYVEPNDALTMTAHWNFALSQSQGKYVTILGVDDGLIPGSMKVLHEILKFKPYAAYSWKKANYNWPNSRFSNQLSLDLHKSLIEIDSNLALRLVSKEKIGYTIFPSPYFGIVERSILEKLRIKTGNYIKSSTPDVYLGFAVASQISKFLYIKYPISINGGSSGSNGLNNSRYKKIEDFTSLIGNTDGNSFPLMPGSLTSAIFEPLMQVEKQLLSKNLPIKRRKILNKCIEESLASGRVSQEILESYLATYDLRISLKKSESRVNNTSREMIQSGPVNNFLYIENLLNLNIDNIKDASRLIKCLVGEIDLNQKILKYTRFYRLVAKLTQKFPSFFYRIRPL